MSSMDPAFDALMKKANKLCKEITKDLPKQSQRPDPDKTPFDFQACCAACNEVMDGLSRCSMGQLSQICQGVAKEKSKYASDVQSFINEVQTNGGAEAMAQFGVVASIFRKWYMGPDMHYYMDWLDLRSEYVSLFNESKSLCSQLASKIQDSLNKLPSGNESQEDLMIAVNQSLFVFSQIGWNAQLGQKIASLAKRVAEYPVSSGWSTAMTTLEHELQERERYLINKIQELARDLGRSAEVIDFLLQISGRVGLIAMNFLIPLAFINPVAALAGALVAIVAVGVPVGAAIVLSVLRGDKEDELEDAKEELKEVRKDLKEVVKAHTTVLSSTPDLLQVVVDAGAAYTLIYKILGDLQDLLKKNPTGDDMAAWRSMLQNTKDGLAEMRDFCQAYSRQPNLYPNAAVPHIPSLPSEPIEPGKPSEPTKPIEPDVEVPADKCDDHVCTIL